MRRIILALTLSAITTSGMFAGSAAASAPAAPGKEVIEIRCAGLGTATISVLRPEQSTGAGQIVGQEGHGIPVEISFTLTDVSIPTVLRASRPAGRDGSSGRARGQQAAELRAAIGGVAYEGTRARVLAGERPEGRVLLHVVDKNGAIHAEPRPNAVELETDIVPCVKAVVDEQVDRNVELREPLDQTGQEPSTRPSQERPAAPELGRDGSAGLAREPLPVDWRRSAVDAPQTSAAVAFEGS
jgi:hypothetical protein